MSEVMDEISEVKNEMSEVTDEKSEVENEICVSREAMPMRLCCHFERSREILRPRASGSGSNFHVQSCVLFPLARGRKISRLRSK